MNVDPVILHAVGQLTVPYRLAVTPAVVEALSYDEAARVANVPVGTSRSRLFCARRLLWAQLSKYVRDFGITRAMSTRPDQ